MKIVIIGSGNVATVLSRKMKNAGHEILQVISRREENAKRLAAGLNCGYTTSFEHLDKGGDIFIVAISDSALLEVHKYLSLDKKLIVHTAGSVPQSVLQNVSENFGVLYPLQSLRKENKNTIEIPLLIDANTAENRKLITDFAKTISDNVSFCGDEERAKLHVGAIIVNNFSNHLYALTEDYCKKESVDFKLLLPLINETANRLQFFSAKELQTGPAIRNDQTTIEKHLYLLKDEPALRKIYEVMTASILGNL